MHDPSHFKKIDFDSLEIFRVYEWIKDKPAEVNRVGRNSVMVCCPSEGHHEDNPSCKLTRGDNVFICYGCGVSGRILEMILCSGVHRPYLGAGVPERTAAIRWLRDQLGMEHGAPTDMQPVSQRSRRAGHRLLDEYVGAIHRYYRADTSLAYVIPRIYGIDAKGKRDKRFEYYRGVAFAPFARERTIDERTYRDVDGRPLYMLVVIGGRTRDTRGIRYELVSTARTPYLPRHVAIRPENEPSLLYRLPELRAAAAAGGDIFFPEGENVADAFHEIGLTATSIPFGANAKPSEEWREHFRGARRIIVPADADPAGRQSAAFRARFLAGVAETVAAIDPFADRVDGYDFADLVRELRARGDSPLTVRAAVLDRVREALQGAA